MNDEPATLPSGAGMRIFSSTHSVVPLDADMSIAERKDAIRDASRKVMLMDDILQIAQGELLWEIKGNEYWREWQMPDEDRCFLNFDEYVDAELSMHRRKAYYLVSIYAKLVVELGLPMEVLEGLNWSKAKELIPVIDEDNWLDLLDKVQEMTVAQVKEMVQDMKGGPATGLVRETFSLHEDEASNISEALALAATIAPSKHKSVHLDMIATAFRAMNLDEGEAGAQTLLSTILNRLEAHYGVSFEVKPLSEGNTDETE